MSKEMINLELVRARLSKQRVDFICDTALPDISASVFFLGLFYGETIVWNMTLDVIKIGEKPYLEIRHGSNGIYPVSVGLALMVIDEPVILKTIIMIRNYKRLAIGRIEFGGMHT